MDKDESILEEEREEKVNEDSTVEENDEIELENDKVDDIQSEKNEKQEEYLNKLIRLQADFDNFRKRSIKEKDEIYKYALANFAEKLLPVIDNLERALKSIEDANISDAYVDGVKMVSQLLVDVLKSEGLEEIQSHDTQFDPQLHHGVAVDNVEDIEDNQIIEVYQKGYKFNDKVIRPAMVKICKK